MHPAKNHKAVELGVWYFLGETYPKRSGRGFLFPVYELLNILNIAYKNKIIFSPVFLFRISLCSALSLLDSLCYHEVLLLIPLRVLLKPSSSLLYHVTWIGTILLPNSKKYSFCFNWVPWLERECESRKVNAQNDCFHLRVIPIWYKRENYVCMGVLLHPCMANGILMLSKLLIWRKGGKKHSRGQSLCLKKSFSSFGKILFSINRWNCI